jgi:hypothetical protein
MQNFVSFSDSNPMLARRLLKNICIISEQNKDKKEYVQHLGIVPKHYSGPYSQTEIALKARILQLEEDLLKTSEERDSALEENRQKVEELNLSLLSVKEELHKIKLSRARKELRFKQLEDKIDKTINPSKARLYVPTH